MTREDEEEQVVIVKKRESGIDGKTVVIGGGVIALLLFLFMRGGGGGKADKQPLLLRLRSDGLWFGHYQKFATVEEAVARIKAGGRSDVALQIAGDIPQGAADTVLQTFRDMGITVYQRDNIASIYQRGLGGSYA